MDSFEFSYSLTPEDYAKASREFALSQPAALILLILWGLLGGFTIYFGLFASGSDQSTVLFCALPSYLSVPLFMLVLIPNSLARRFWKQQGTSAQVTWTIDDSRLHVSTPRTKYEMDWDLLGTMVETKQYYLLPRSTNKGLVDIVPKRAFESSEQEAEFRRRIEQYVGPIK